MRYQRLACAGALIIALGGVPGAEAEDRGAREFGDLLYKLEHTASPIARRPTTIPIAPPSQILTDDQIRQAQAEEREGGILPAEAEALIRSAGFVCIKARRIWQIPRLRDGATNVLCDSGRGGDKDYQFEIKDYGGRIIVRAFPT